LLAFWKASGEHWKQSNWRPASKNSKRAYRPSEHKLGRYCQHPTRRWNGRERHAWHGARDEQSFMKYRNSMWRRIAVLEKRLPRPLQPDAEAGYFRDMFISLLERMDTAYRAHVLADIQRSPVGFDHRSTNLTMAAARYVWQHVQCGTPLEMPAEVAAVFAQDSQARTRQECEDCGYDLPKGFALCPLCGGRVGMGGYAFYGKHGYGKPADAPHQAKLLQSGE
jgi:hypothetical protein